MTLAELFDAIDGYNEQEKTRLEWMLFAARKQIVTARWIAGDKDCREEDVFHLDLDDELREARYKNMEPIKVTVHGTEQ